MAEGRLHPRPHRRRVLRDRGRPRARQEVQARHRGGGRPHRRPRRHRAAPRRQLRDRAQARRGPRLSRSGRPAGRPPGGRADRRRRGAGEGRRAPDPRHSRPRRPHHLLREIRLPGLAASPSPRSSRACSASTRRRAPARPATASARSWCSTRTSSSPTTRSSIKKGAVVPWAKSNPPSPYYMQVLAQPRPRLRLRPRHAVERPARGSAARHPPRHRRQARHPALHRRPQAATRSRSRSRASSATSTAACSRPKARGCARSCRSYQAQPPVRGLPRRPPQPEALAVKIAGEDISHVHPPQRRRRPRLVRARSHDKLTPTQNEIAKRHPQGDQRAPRLPPQCRARLSPPRPHQRHAVAAARASASASPARSARGLSGVLYVLDEPSIGLHQQRQRPPARNAQAPARPRQHRARRRA